MNMSQNYIPKKQNLYTLKTKSFDKLGFIADYLSIDWNTILEPNKNDEIPYKYFYLTYTVHAPQESNTKNKI